MAPSFSSVVTATEGSAIAARIAAEKLVVSSGALPAADTSKVLRDDWIIAIASGPTASARLLF